MNKELPLCKCGCGNTVERKTKKYFEDHYKNPPEKIILSKEVFDTNPDFAIESEVIKPKTAAKIKKKKVKSVSKEYTKEEKRQQFLRNLRNNKRSNYYLG